MVELRQQMEDVFARIATTPQWPDPYPARDPDEAAYSRVTDAAKWRILHERVDAWFVVIGSAGLATIQRDIEQDWGEPHGPLVERTDRLVPRRAGAIPIVAARSMGVVIGVGDPAVRVGLFPDCGCDACDGGSAAELDGVDRLIAGVVNGEFRRLARGRQSITVIDGAADGWSASNMRSRRRLRHRSRFDQIADIVDHPTGWTEISGPAWTP